MAIQTAERISHNELADNVIFQRSLFAYQEASKLVSGTVVEIGTGMGYGIDVISPKADQYFAIDKYLSGEVKKHLDNGKIKFFQANVPPMNVLPENMADTIVSFQVIEHIKNDYYFLQEINRLLKPGGKVIITTPNKPMSLTRNPWHVREYSGQKLENLLFRLFKDVHVYGVFGNEKVMEYYEENKRSVKKYTRFDILNMQYWLPRKVLQIPYDILNRINRKKLLDNNQSNVMDISSEDYFLKDTTEGSFDLFAVAVKA
jgi:2-polyprenyl-3-methyl-5-hydroxy-6-metoxy-1,4-benzoquinol methylase